MQGGISILLEPQNTGPDFRSLYVLWSHYLGTTEYRVGPGIFRLGQGGIDCVYNIIESSVWLIIWDALGTMQ
jgi:hypothetical protein